MVSENALGMVFPGQGSQSVGMLAELARDYPQVEETFRAASSALDEDLWHLIQEGPEARLNQTEYTQPAMLAAGVAVWRVWRETGGAAPERLARHRLGEYTALVCAQALEFGDAVRLVHDRGRYMQAAVAAGEGAMAAILGLDDAAVERDCAETAGDQVVEAVNFNAPGQVVIAGHRGAVDRAVVAAKDAGAKRAGALPVGVPSHCALMRPAAEQLAERLQAVPLRPAAIPVLHNVDCTESGDAEAIRERLVAQLYRPVRWAGTITAMTAAGVAQIVEAGPGRVLTGLNRRIDRRLPPAGGFGPGSLHKALGKEG